MTYKTAIDKIKQVVEAYNGTLSFEYGKVWDMNAKPSRVYPCLLVECQPDFNFGGIQSNYRMGKQLFKGKLFLYDTYHQAQREVKPLWEKQSDLNEIMLQIGAELKRVFLNDLQVDLKIKDGFFGWFEQHNSKLVEVFVPFEFEINECTLASFTYV